MSRPDMRKIGVFAARLVGGVAILGAIVWLAQVTEPWWRPAAYHWKYSETPSAGGTLQALAIEARTSTMTTPGGHDYTPTLAVTCQNGYANITMDLAYSACIGDCSKGAVIDVGEYFVTDPSARSQTGQQASWHTASATQVRAKRFYDPSESASFAKDDAPKAIAFIRQLAASKEFLLEGGPVRAKFITSGLASELPRLEKSCPALK